MRDTERTRTWRNSRGSLLSFLVCAVTGCSSLPLFSGSTGDPSVAAPNGESVTLDIFSARGFLGGSDYERYFLQDGVLWRECGNIVSGKKSGARRPSLEGDAVLKSDPQLTLQERRVEKLDAKQVRSLSSKVSSLLAALENTTPLPPPGSVFSLSDPGLFELMVGAGTTKHRVITSVDAVAEQESETLVSTHQLFAEIRGIGPEICGSSTFFGIAKTAGEKRATGDITKEH